MTATFRSNPSDPWAISWQRARGYFSAAGSAMRAAEAWQPHAAAGAKSADGPASAVVPVVGPIAKDEWIEYFGGTSSLKTQAAIRAARLDPSVDSVLLLVDSPGGEVAGIEELAAEVAATAAVKPVHAHIDDLGASAAYWIASQASLVTANETAMVGSVGAVVVVADMSRALEEAGVKLHAVASGDKKAPFADGSVTPEALEDLQGLIDAVADVFGRTVQAGRGLSDATLADIRDGRLMRAQDGLDLGLIDAIATRSASFEMLRGKASEMATRRRRAEAVGARMKALGVGLKRKR